MNVITIISTRPEIIRLSSTIKQLDKLLGKNHILVHTGQNFTATLHKNFFSDLDLRQPDYQFNLIEQKTGYEFGGYLMIEMTKLLSHFDKKTDKILILGDTNGAYYSAYVARKMGFKIYHAEAGNRCWDDNVPEEVNRKAIDSFSYKLLPYTQRSRENLLREGYHPKDIIVIGNPIFQILYDTFGYDWLQSKSKEKRNHILCTFHRHENINNKKTVNEFINQLNKIKDPVLLSLHPSLAVNIDLSKFNSNIEVLEPIDFKTFIELEATAKCVITDSGTVPEECSIFNTPCILLRSSTERPELLEVNQMIVNQVSELNNTYQQITKLDFIGFPTDYSKQVSGIITKLLLGDL